MGLVVRSVDGRALPCSGGCAHGAERLDASPWPGFDGIHSVPAQEMGLDQPRGLREPRARLALPLLAGDPHHRVAEVLPAAGQVTHIPLMPGPWLPLAESEAQAFLERLTSVLVRSHGPAAFTKNLPISGLRVTPLSFYPGWLLVEGEAQLAPNELGTFNVLYGPGFMWVIDGESKVIHNLNSGRIPDTGSMVDGNGVKGVKVTPAFLPSPLIKLDTSVTGPDYLRFFCGSIWGDEGPFLLVESPDAAILQGATFPDDTRRKHIKPIAMQRVDDYLTGEAAVIYADSLFSAKFKVQNGEVFMEDDEPLAADVIPKQRYQSPFRNVRAGTTQTADTTGGR